MRRSIESKAPSERAKYYRQLAREVLQLAGVASTEKAKQSFRHLAKRWLALAAQVEQYESEDISAQPGAIN